MYFIRLVVFLLIASFFIFVPPASAQSLVGMGGCGEEVWVADLIKGRTDSLLVHARYTQDCVTYDYTNYAPAGKGEAQGNSWQKRYCIEDGQDAVYRHFLYHHGITIDPSKVKVTCSNYNGPD